MKVVDLEQQGNSELNQKKERKNRAKSFLNNFSFLISFRNIFN